MAFVMIAPGTSSRSRVRNVPARLLMLGCALAALVLLAVGFGFGYWLSTSSHGQPAEARDRQQAAAPFTLEQVGKMSGRLFRLENEAAQLGARIGVPTPEGTPAPPRQGKPAPAGDPDASGGPLLPPHVESIDLDTLGARLARVERQIALVADALTLRKVESMRLPTLLPIAGAELASTFGNRIDPFTHASAFHGGLDFAAERGTPIFSAAGGTVVFAGFKPDFGWLVEIDHGNGLTTRYAHASKLMVKSGEVVAPGTPVAAVGSTGRSTGPHLHFEVLRDGEHIDPKAYLAGL